MFNTLQLNYMKATTEDWGNNSYDHIVIWFYSVILEDFSLEA